MFFCRGVHSATKIRNGAFCGLRLTVQSHYATRKLSTISSYQFHLQRSSPFVSPASARNFSLFGWTTGKNTPAEDNLPTPAHPTSQSSSASPPNEEVNSTSTALADKQLAGSPSETITQTTGLASPSSSSPPLVSDSDVSSFASSVVEPIGEHIGDLHSLGLARFTPVGAVQAALEFVHVMTGIPWWGSIITVTIVLRAIGLHFSLTSLRASARMIPVRPKVAELNQEMQEASASGDFLKKQTTMIKIRKLQRESGVGFWAILQGPAYQIVTSVVGFLAVKRASDLPVPQMQAENFFWIPSLTSTDPYVILPLLSGALAILQSRVTRPDMKATGSPISMHMPNVMPFLSLFTVLILLKLPVAPILSILTNMIWMILQSRILHIPRVRRSLELPPLPTVNKGDFPSMRETGSAIINYFKNRQTKALAEQQQKLQQRPHFPARNTRDTRSTQSGVQK